MISSPEFNQSAAKLSPPRSSLSGMSSLLKKAHMCKSLIAGGSSSRYDSSQVKTLSFRYSPNVGISPNVVMKFLSSLPR